MQLKHTPGAAVLKERLDQFGTSGPRASGGVVGGSQPRPRLPPSSLSPRMKSSSSGGDDDGGGGGAAPPPPPPAAVPVVSSSAVSV